jgi:predicted transcriptional regulator
MNNSYIKVSGHENLYRDSRTGAIINKETPPPKNLSKIVTNAVEDINNLKEELSEIKSLLKTIVENGIRS